MLSHACLADDREFVCSLDIIPRYHRHHGHPTGYVALVESPVMIGWRSRSSGDWRLLAGCWRVAVG
jgi:hypothetical protein